MNKTQKRFINNLKESLIGSQFKDRGGNIYTVLMLTNTNSTLEELKIHPIDIIYMGQDGNVWSRRLSDWDGKFTKIKTKKL